MKRLHLVFLIMILATIAQGQTNNEIKKQYLTFQITPPDAMLEVNDQIWNINEEGKVQKLLDLGSYSYRVQAPDYHTASGVINLNNPDETITVKVSLKPNFGWIEVKDNGDMNGAIVFIDNVMVGKVPFKSEAIKSGQHSVKIAKELFDTFSTMVTVSDNETSTVTPHLTANSAQVTLQVDADAEIWVNDQRKGTRSWTGKLECGTYKVECKLAGYETTSTRKAITSQMNGEVIVLEAPKPIFGMLDVESTPDLATIYLDGKEMGKTPKLIKEIIIGQHELRISKDAYGDYTTTVTITKEERIKVSAVLSNYEQLAKKGDEYYNAKNYEEALKCYREAAEHGNAVGQNGLGRLYSAGYAVEQDKAEAVKWFRLAAEQGLDRAQNNLANYYFNGKVVEKDYEEALKWYRKAAEQGLVQAQLTIATIYARGDGVEIDYGEAMKWFRKAAEQNNAQAQYSIGISYYYGNGVAKDSAEAAKWIRKAAEQGMKEAQYNLGVMYTIGDGVTKNNNEAEKWLSMAAEQGHKEAQYNLGVMYLNEPGTAPNYNEAAKWFKKAAEQGHPGAQYNLGVMYHFGYGVAQDYNESIKWHLKAAEQGHLDAQNNIATMYKDGIGVEQNYIEAEKWYLKAAEQGNANAQYNLGIMYITRTDDEKNSAEGLKWLMKAAEQGHEQAKVSLKNAGMTY